MDQQPDIPATAARRRPRVRESIALPDGEVLDPRQKFARDIGVSDKTIARMNLPTVYISNVAHVKRNASLQILADSAQRRNQPQKPRRTSAA
jgi:hypothetical protein